MLKNIELLRKCEWILYCIILYIVLWIIFTLKNTEVTFRLNHLYALMDTTFSVRILKGGGFLHILINIVINTIKQKNLYLLIYFLKYTFFVLCPFT